MERGPKTSPGRGAPLTAAVQPLVQKTTGEVGVRRQLPMIAADAVVPDMALHVLPKIGQHRRATAYPQRSEALIERPELAPKPLAFRTPTNDEITSATATHIMREAQKTKGLGSALPILLAAPRGGTAKPNESGLGGLDLQREGRQAFFEFHEKSPSVLLPTESRR